jgi:biotin-(acetyl-CoA carboxylase) ligase
MKERIATRSEVLMILLKSLENNYKDLVNNGSQNLIRRYKDKSIIVGRKVVIFADKPNDELEEIAKGTIIRIGDNLELYLDTQKEPVTRGRLAFI